MIGLELKAELEGVTNLHFRDSQTEYYQFKFRVECEGCHEENPKPVDFNAHEKVEAEHTRGEFSFVMKCKMCKRTGTILVHSVSKNGYSSEDAKSVNMATFDVRGLRLIEFVPDGLFKCESAHSAAKFDEVELIDGEWYDYDESASSEVSIQNVEWSLVKLKH
ncbi:hypothetical protein B9G98_00408 [Wickerhamiella sorbophila]|uniref:Uncharacterized protein n=1 Tax=Wickerhamiella sorbophila TaxID=45607 RepID=A0A2T0FCQ8_9ASCO|nr:hypothetical protein B9G98_00408 [Wickerhamiella sorbophila]PRT52788.1 hypothetical protein B9G98_00408 [Wickerhamiella sorbophila]